MDKDKLGGHPLLEISAGDGRYRVVCTAIRVGQDVTIQIQGGERPHIGAVAMAIPRPSLKDPTRLSATASVLTVIGHKEDELARSIALHLATELSCVAVVLAGVHLDGADENDIARIVENSDQVVRMLVEAIRDKTSS